MKYIFNIKRILTLFAFLFSVVSNAQTERTRIALKPGFGYARKNNSFGLTYGCGLLVQKKVHTFHLLFDGGFNEDEGTRPNKYTPFNIATTYGPGYYSECVSLNAGTGVGFMHSAKRYTGSSFLMDNVSAWEKNTIYNKVAIPINVSISLHSERVGFFVQATNYFSKGTSFDLKVLSGLEINLRK